MKYAKVRDVKSPVRGTEKSAGIDLFIPNDFMKRVVNPGEDILIPSGLKFEVPKGYMLMGAEKSGVVTSKQAALMAGRTPKQGAFSSILIMGAKIGDEDYQGEMHIHLINVGKEPITLRAGMKISQLILVPVLYAELEECPEDKLFEKVSERGEGGFGSTDKQL